MSDMAAGQLWGYGICVAAGMCSGVLGSLFWFISKLFRNSRAVAWIMRYYTLVDIKCSSYGGQLHML